MKNLAKKWPELDYKQGKETLEFLHLCSQMVGKIKLKVMPWINHSWHVALYVSARGFRTGLMSSGDQVFELEFDLLAHQLHFSSATNTTSLSLQSPTVATFYEELFTMLNAQGVSVKINPRPNELPASVPFNEDKIGRKYQPETATAYLYALQSAENVMTKFRSRFAGKASPVHLFWGGFDLTTSRFSGKPAPTYRGAVPSMSAKVMQEAYSHEVTSCGFWPGNELVPEASFYAYCYPVPEQFKKEPVEPKGAYFNEQVGEFLLPYESVRASGTPEEDLLAFFESTYRAATSSLSWDPAPYAFNGV